MPRTPKRSSDRIYKTNALSDMWWTRIKPLTGPTQRRSTGTSDPRQAERIVAMVDTLRLQSHFDLIARVASGAMSLPELYDAFVGDRLDALRVTLDDTDLSPVVQAWSDELTGGGEHKTATVTLWVSRVRDLIPADEPFPRSQLTVARVKVWVAALTTRGLKPTTRHHYGIALRAFSRWATRNETLPFNPLGEWSPPTKGPSRDKYWQWDVCKRVLDAMPDGESGSLDEKYKMAITLMMATGMELSAAMVVTGSDVNRHLKTAWAHGRKTIRQGTWRNRNCHVRRWAWPSFERFAKPCLHGAFVFDGVVEVTLRQHFYEAQAAVGLVKKVWSDRHRDYVYNGAHTMHDLRRTFCYLVCSGEDGEKVPKNFLHHCKRQLGHGTLKMVQEIYANFGLGDAPDDGDDTLDADTSIALVR